MKTLSELLRIFLLVAVVEMLFCSNCFSRDFFDFEDTPIPVVYGKAFAIVEPKTGSVMVIQGSSDPVLFCSRATFFVWKFDSLAVLTSMLKLQHEKGPSMPKEIDLSKSKLITVEANGTALVKFEAFTRRFLWSGGNEKIGWLYLKSNVGLKFLDLSGETTDFSFAEDQMVPLADYIKENTERLVQESTTKTKLSILR